MSYVLLIMGIAWAAGGVVLAAQGFYWLAGGCLVIGAISLTIASVRWNG